MKKIFLSLATVALLASCGGSQNNAETATEEETPQEQTPSQADDLLITDTYVVDVETSVLKWAGDKIVGNGHVGTINIKGGVVELNEGTVVGGEITVDMNTMVETDFDSQEYADKLIVHLKSEDFFKVEQFPTAVIKVKSVTDGSVTADLTILETTKEITFPAQIVVDGEVVTVNASFSINRTDWGIIYGSGSFFDQLTKDKIIKDQIDFEVNVKAEKK